MRGESGAMGRDSGGNADAVWYEEARGGPSSMRSPEGIQRRNDEGVLSAGVPGHARTHKDQPGIDLGIIQRGMCVFIDGRGRGIYVKTPTCTTTI